MMADELIQIPREALGFRREDTAIPGNRGVLVYHGKGITDQQDVAMKFFDIPKSGTNAAKQSLEREVTAYARIHSERAPHIVPYRTSGIVEHEGVMFGLVITDWMPGGTLQDKLDKARTARGEWPISIDDILRCGIDVASALTEAHEMQKPVLHGDIRPSNIFYDKEGNAKLGDFGLARIRTTHMAVSGDAYGYGKMQHTSLGDPEYLAPELKDPNRTPPITAKTDIYALGVVLLDLIGKNSDHGVYTRPIDINPNVSPKLDEAITRAVEGESRRYASARELLNYLKICRAEPQLGVYERTMEKIVSLDPTKWLGSPELEELERTLRLYVDHIREGDLAYPTENLVGKITTRDAADRDLMLGWARQWHGRQFADPAQKQTVTAQASTNIQVSHYWGNRITPLVEELTRVRGFRLK